MHQNLSRMSFLEVIIFLCSALCFMVSNCETKSENSSRTANLPKFLSKLDLSSVDSSIENEEPLRKIVKRLAPEKNGVTGQPGVDFPALTTIPVTSFSCRGLKGGYYADLETNCQVFHICDNGRKISFLCPNGTIFQQSQLICDWWFKVDCSKSAELYEQSSEQLVEEEKKRAELRKTKLEHHRSESGGQQDYYDVQNLNYDGKQNGRIKPYEEPPQENQLQPNRERVKPSRHFDSGNNFNQESNAQKENNHFFLGNSYQSNQHSNAKQEFNQFGRNTDDGNSNRYPTTSQEYYNPLKKIHNYHVGSRNSNAQRDDKEASKTLKIKGANRNNSYAGVSQRVTPAYTESTTFRVSNNMPIKESQQVAESAAFVGNRGNRFNENTGSSHQYYYQLYINRDITTRSPNYDTTSATTWRQSNDNDFSTQRNDFLSFTDTTSAFYETTPPCNEDTSTENPISTNPSNFDTQPTTESLQFANSRYEYRANQRNTYSNNNNNKNNNNANSNSETIPPTIRPYVTTNTYRQTTATPTFSQQKHSTNIFSSAPTVSFRSNNFGTITNRPKARNPIDNQSNNYYGDTKSIAKNSPTISPGYRQNFISTTTQKPLRTTSFYQQQPVTEKDLSPYDRSFTYKQGKVMSTLGPTVPFTRNYSYNSTSPTTANPSPYTPTVPAYTTLHTSSKTLLPKLKYAAPTLLSKLKSDGTRYSERQHALSMLSSLKKLEDRVSSLSEVLKGGSRLYNVSAPPAPSTLHSLALYFSTATENFDSNEATDSSISVQSAEDTESSVLSKKSNGTVQVPTSLLTQHTINSYAELFKLNDAVQTNNVTTEDRLDNASIYGEDYNEDLELQQSGGSLDDFRKSNNVRLRELAQVFTHALSAYLIDPDTFKKVLTEIRPTEPPESTIESEWSSTTAYPTGDEENTLPTRERDEVLDFSDDGNDVRQKLTTTYPTTPEPPSTTVAENAYEILSTVPSTYYTTSRSRDDFEHSTYYPSMGPVTSSYFETSVPSTESTVAFERNTTPYSSDASGFYNQDNAIDKGNIKETATDIHVPSDGIGNPKRVGGFQNNSVTIVTEPYDNEGFSITTPVNDNYPVSPTPSSPSVFVHMVTYNWNKKSTSKKPEQQLTPPLYETYSETGRRDNGGTSSLENYSSTPMPVNNARATTSGSGKSYDIPTDHPHKIPRHKSLLPETKHSGISPPVSRSSYVKFRNLYSRGDERNVGSTERPITTTEAATETMTTTINPTDTTPCANVDSDFPVASVNQREEPKASNNDPWTSSPGVTHLWETSVFVDPQRINHGLEPVPGTTVSIGTYGTVNSQETLDYGNTPSFSEDISSSSESFIDEEELAPSAQRLSRDKDSPTTFSLLPTAFIAENSATPKPLITTRSSITTTITSSITSTNSLPRESLVASSPPHTADGNKLNDTENEIAEKLFGALNASSTNTLMRVMKQADKNETVRELVLLLIRHCNDPANKTMQQEKEELLNALLRLPVNEFSSEESRNVVAGINQLSLPAVRSVGSTRNSPTSPLITEPPVTTFRSRKNRKFRTTTEHSTNIVRRSEKGVISESRNLLPDDETSASDNRALELLRSLYTIATKWG